MKEESENNPEKSHSPLGLLERIVSLIRCRVVSVFCGFLVFVSVWTFWGRLAEIYANIEYHGYWMLYGIVIYKLSSAIADRVEKIVYKSRG